MSLCKKFLMLVGLFALLIAGVGLARTWLGVHAQARVLAAAQADLALQFDLAIRQYVGETLRPRLAGRFDDDEFIPELMSRSFIARGIFEKVRKEFPDYLLKFSSDHPRNPANAAGPEEQQILAYFRAHPEAKVWTGRAEIGGRAYVVHCLPRRVEASCLRCHGRAQDAPASLLARYGAEAGFGWPVGQVVAVDMVGIPVGAIDAIAASEVAKSLWLMVPTGLALAGAFVFAYRWLIGSRLSAIAAHLQSAVTRTDEGALVPIAECGHDEIGTVARSYNALAARLRQLHDSLEQRVKERTASLEAEIAERIRVEKALRESERRLAAARDAAEAANRAKSEFLANISHEIRTPMTAILGYVDLLAESMPAERLDDSIPENPIEVIRENADHLLRLIDNVLDLSKIEAGKLAIEHNAFSPEAVLAEVVSLMRPRADAKRLDLAVQWRGLVPETIRTDAVRLRQILINLVGNAVKFTESGYVQLIAQIEGPTECPQLRVEVADTGIGMTRDVVDRLFRPFTQADASTSRRFGGTGLGLSISKRLAQRLGGDLVVASAPGQGSIFTVTVPIGPLEGVRMLSADEAASLQRSRRQSQAAAVVAKLPPGCRVLLAEDGQDNQRLVSHVLRKAGAEVIVADNGQAAVDLATAAVEQGQPFDVVLMDMQMPVLDGYEATRRLRAAGFQIPIVACTAHAMPEDRQKCLDCGCDDYLVKPIDRPRLLATVAAQIARAAKADQTTLVRSQG